jgi:creatinine amidohydrolase
LPYGPTPEHRNFGSGFIDLPQPLHEAVVESVLESLVGQGFRRIVIWRGCGQHELINVVGRFNVIHNGESKVFQPDLPYHDLWCSIGDKTVPGGHADSFMTSLALFLRPDAVRKHLISNPVNDPVDWEDSSLDFARYSRTGVIGDPTHASAELGARLWAGAVEAVANILVDIARQAV